MKYVFYVLLLVSIVFGNDELNNYINDKSLQSQIIKDVKDQILIVDLLDKKNQILIFKKEQNEDYKKTFDEKVYFCKTTNIIWFQSIFPKGNYYMISCFSNYVDRVQRDIVFYFNFKNLKLIKITREDSNQDGILQDSYIFKPIKNIPTLYDFKKENFSDEYLNENDKNFVQVKLIIPKTIEELLNAIQNKKSNTILTTDFNIIFENEELNQKTVQKYNDIAYYLQQANANDEAIFLLEKILEKFPNRTVAYLNLADAYDGLGNKEKAKENYEKYINLMKEDNKEVKIPKRVLEFK
ncbi:MAG: tetratricopeptide repeat protein [Aliarcobacter sp.]|nr:tetratricopeptide repeat protein [Aliarcobacter sp.]